MAMSVWPVRQARPGGVGDHDADVGAGPLGDRPAQRPGAAVRVERQEQHAAPRDVGRVDPGRGQGEPEPGAHDRGRSAPRHHPGARLGQLGLDGGDAVGARERAALGLAHHLAGHQHHVSVDGRQRRDDQRGQVVAGPDLGDAVRREDGQASRSTSSIAAAAIAAVASWSVM